MAESSASKFNLVFWIHLLVLILGWSGPFLIDWRVMVVAYMAVQVQFIFFKRCLMNKGHELEDDDDATFYSFLLELFGMKVPRKPIKLVVRNGLYIFLALLAFTWQYVLGHKVMFTIPL